MYSDDERKCYILANGKKFGITVLYAFSASLSVWFTVSAQRWEKTGLNTDFVKIRFQRYYFISV